MGRHIFENFFGEKPHEQIAKRIANGALNSYEGTKDNFVHRLNSVVENNRLHEKWRSEYMRFELKMQEQYRAGLAEGRKEERRELSSKIWTKLVEQLGEEAALKIMPNPFCKEEQEV